MVWGRTSYKLIRKGIEGASEILKRTLFSRTQKSTTIQIANSTNNVIRERKPSYGILFDIDGVICRGGQVLPEAKEAFRRLVDGSGRLKMPVVFVTNAGNALRQMKAKQLSDWLGIEVDIDQVLMSHSALKMFKQFHDKHIFASGQGPIREIASGLGFTNVSTVEDIKNTFPNLDRVDCSQKRNAPQNADLQKYFPPIEVVILFGEPIRWETNLQLIIDLLVTNGLPTKLPDQIPFPHIPVLACNMDLMWVAEANLPRIGHGAFLLCLEENYKKITGYDLAYTALIGKPSEITYHHAEYCIAQQAAQLGWDSPVQRMYAIGDNPDTDISGANLYNRYLMSKGVDRRLRMSVEQNSNNSSRDNITQLDAIETIGLDCSENGHEMAVASMESILVCTGIFNKKHQEETPMKLYHGHRDFLIDRESRKPTYVVKDVLNAVELILERETGST